MTCLCHVRWGTKTDWCYLGQWLAEQRQLKEQYIPIKHGICREPFCSWARRCSKIKNMFHFPLLNRKMQTDGETQQGGWICKLKNNSTSVLGSVLSLEEVISSPAKVSILWVWTQEVSPSLHSCSTSHCSLWQEGPVLAASLLSLLGPFAFSLSHYSQADCKTSLLRTALSWPFIHSTYLWRKW